MNDPGHATPKGWLRTPLLDVADLETGHTPSRNHTEYWNGEVGWLGIRDARAHHGGIINDTAQTVTQLGLENSAARLLPKETVCLSRTASVGYVVKLGRPMATSQDFVAWVCGDALDPDFLLMALLAEGEDIRRFGEGSTHTTIYFPEVKAFHIDLPPLAEQRRIVAKLDALTDCIARARAELDRVPALARNLRAAAIAAVRTKLHDAPELSVADVAASIFDGPFGSNLKSADYVASGVRVVRLENIGHLHFVEYKKTYVSEDKYKTLTRHTLVPGDILFSSFVDREIRVCRFPSNNEGPAINKADCFVVRVDAERYDARFIMYMLAAPETYQVLKEKVHGATRPRIALSHLRDISIHVPSRVEQVALADHLDSTFARADRVEAGAARALALLDRLEAAILGKAFRGELVPQDPNDEPASVLLDRTRTRRVTAQKPRRGRGAAPKTEARAQWPFLIGRR